MTLLHLLQILLLAIIQGAAEMLPISSSAHVTVVARLLGFDLGSDADVAAAHRWAFLLVMLHTGTMAAVLLYFRRRWLGLLRQWPALLAATAVTGAVGFGLKTLIEHTCLRDPKTGAHGHIETLFHNLPLIAASLAAVGLLILVAGLKERRQPGASQTVSFPQALLQGLVQAICLPFRGLSRSGSTISVALLQGVNRLRAEEFSFALAVLLTPALIAYEGYKLVGTHTAAAADSRAAGFIPVGAAATDSTTAPAPEKLTNLLLPGLAGMAFSFLSGLVGLWLLSRWLEQGHWWWFGVYCLAASAVVLAVHFGLPATSWKTFIPRCPSSRNCKRFHPADDAKCPSSLLTQCSGHDSKFTPNSSGSRTTAANSSGPRDEKPSQAGRQRGGTTASTIRLPSSGGIGSKLKHASSTLISTSMLRKRVRATRVWGSIHVPSCPRLYAINPANAA